MDSGVYTGEPKLQPLVYIELQPPDYKALMPWAETSTADLHLVEIMMCLMGNKPYKTLNSTQCQSTAHMLVASHPM